MPMCINMIIQETWRQVEHLHRKTILSNSLPAILVLHIHPPTLSEVYIPTDLPSSIPDARQRAQPRDKL
jgi:hypothetical protein